MLPAPGGAPPDALVVRHRKCGLRADSSEPVALLRCARGKSEPGWFPHPQPTLPHRLERAHSIGLRGAVLAADAFLTPEAAAGLAPVLAAADRLGSHLFVHPGPVVAPPERMVRDSPGHGAWQRRILLETQARLSEVVVTLGLSGLLDAYPGVTVQVANLGGAIPFLVERMDEAARREAGPLPSERLHSARLHVDTASFGPRAIAAAVACFGAERVPLGSDSPISDAGRAVQAVEAAGLGTGGKALVLGGNARRLFG